MELTGLSGHTLASGSLRRHKQHTGVKSMPYDDLVREALCFGWVDSLIKRLDDDRYAIKVTPRKSTSKWWAINRRRWNALKTAGLLAAPGLAAALTENSCAPHPSIPELPAYIATAFKKNLTAWQHFEALPDVPASFRRLDSYGEETGNAGNGYSRID